MARLAGTAARGRPEDPSGGGSADVARELEPARQPAATGRGRGFARVVRLLFWLYVFMLSIKLMGAGFKTLGSQYDLEGMLSGAAATPLMGVCVGLLVTAIVQSSSFTTSMLVALVAAGTLDLTHAVPMVMGANIGTTITNSLVAAGHAARRREFERAFGAGVVHDIFNLLTVAILLPLEAFFHPLARLAAVVTGPIGARIGGSGGSISKGPVHAIIAPVVHALESLLDRLIDNPVWIGVGLLVVAVVLLFLALSRMVVVLKQVFIGGFQRVVNEVLFKRWWTALIFGIGLTALAQSSSMTVSLLVPMVAGGLLTVQQIFPFTLGANIGTTLTAFLAAAVAGSPAGITLATTHLLFNMAGTAIFLPLRAVPISIARRLASAVYRRRWISLVYIVVVFFLVPIAILFISRLAYR